MLRLIAACLAHGLDLLLGDAAAARMKGRGVPQRAFQTYEQVNKDKDWSLIDCTSFLIMSDQGISVALTEDHHFTQAGFTIAKA